MDDGKLLVNKFLQRKFRNIRETLNTERVHFMPLNLEAFRKVLASSLEDPSEVENIYLGVLNYLKSKHTNSMSISALGKMPKNALYKNPALIYEKTADNIIGVAYQGYNAAYGAAFRGYLNSIVTKTIKTPLGQTTYKESPSDLLSDTKYAKSAIKKGFDVGHLYGGADSSFGDTPLSYKLRILQEAINNLSENKLVLAERTGVVAGSSKQTALLAISAKITGALQELEERSNLGKDIITTTLSKTVTNNLASIKAVIIVPQGRYENQYEFGVKIEAEIERDIGKVLSQVRFSPSLQEEVVTRLGNILSNKPNKNVNASLKVVTPVNKLVKTKVRATKEVGKNLTARVTPVKRELLNLTSLQALLDKHLQDVISANMGDGKERRILNYRTGRFAASAKVERLSQSREGMVTAFYTYMKNPYQTFEPGFRQGSPKSRDPKLLIAGAIREIAATTMITKMRSVSI